MWLPYHANKKCVLFKYDYCYQAQLAGKRVWRSKSCAEKHGSDHQVRFDKRWMIRHRAYDRSVSELTLSKMKCTLGDVEADPSVLFLCPFSRSNGTRPTKEAYLRERRVPALEAPANPLYTSDFEYKFHHM